MVLKRIELGTLFTPQNTNSSSNIRNKILAISRPSLTAPPPPALNATIDKLLELYPNVPALGSPFGTGNATFGLSPEYKRLSAVCKRIFVRHPESG